MPYPPRTHVRNALLGLTLCAAILLIPVHGTAGRDAYERCLQEALTHADTETTVGELRAMCEEHLRDEPERSGDAGGSIPAPAPAGGSAVNERLARERESQENPFAILPHKPNYLLPVTYNGTPNPAAFPGDEEHIDNIEVKFQISLKSRILDHIYKGRGSLYAAYTNLSFWQAYNRDISSPFRETNHEPELWLQFENPWGDKGFGNRLIRIGAVHQSNGRSGALSRSWNRLYLNALFEWKDLTLSLKPWYRIPEHEKTNPGEPSGDDNPDIEDYLGYGELRAVYRLDAHLFSLMLRNNLRHHGNRGAVELGWTFPLYKEWNQIKGYVQYFNGYGESLIDYNASTNRIGIGVLLTDWL